MSFGLAIYRVSLAWKRASNLWWMPFNPGTVTLGAYVDLNDEAAMSAARDSAQRYREGSARPLEGIPVGVKDILNVTGQSCQCGSKILNGYTAPYTATAVQQLQDAGAIILGRLNMGRICHGLKLRKIPRSKRLGNPWALDRVPGGSSGGLCSCRCCGYGISDPGN